MGIEYFLEKPNSNIFANDEEFIADIVSMSSSGVSCIDDEEKYIKISSILSGQNKRRHIEKISKELISNNAPATVQNIKIAADNLGIKIGYNNEGDARILPQYNLEMWVQATNGIYSRMANGMTFNDAFQDVTNGWDKMEKLDFKHWHRHYSSGESEKYKTAQFFVTPEGLTVPNVKKLSPRLPMPVNRHPDTKPEGDSNSVRDTVEKQRSRIIGRLNAAEKLLASMDGQMFAGDDQEYMLKLLQDLKRKVQTANKITVRSSLFQDFIYRTANMLKSTGKSKASGFFTKLAQMPMDMPDMGMSDMGGSGMGEASKEETVTAIKKFIQMLNKEASVKIAQDLTPQPVGDIAPPASPPTDIPIPNADLPSPQIDGDVTNPDNGLESATVDKEDNTDDVIEAALGNITINDAVSRLEMIASIYKRREASRQLSILDIMMDKLGIISFFPEIGEAMAKALEANQYISTRVEDVLAKLKGTMETPETKEWTSAKEEVPASPEVEQVRQSLIADKQKEEDSKKARKEREDAKLAGPAPAPAPAPEKLDIANEIPDQPIANPVT